MKICGYKISNLKIIEKVMFTLTLKFGYIVVIIEESKNLDEMKVEELQGSLAAYEQRMNERNLVIKPCKRS